MTVGLFMKKLLRRPFSTARASCRQPTDITDSALFPPFLPSSDPGPVAGTANVRERSRTTRILDRSAEVSMRPAGRVNGPSEGFATHVRVPQGFRVRVFLVGGCRARFLALLPGVLALTHVARADPATAEALFREGRRLLDEGHYDAACTKLAESQAQDAASGTLINLALCYEKQGKLASAWAEYRAAAAHARSDGRPDRVASAERSATAIEPRVPYLVIHAIDVTPGTELTWGTNRLGAGAFGSKIPIDPGSYVIAVTAPGYRTWTTPVAITEGEVRTLELPALERLPPPPIPTPPATAAAPAKATEPARPAAPPPSGNAARTWALVLGGTGVVALGVGTAYGVSSLSAYSDAEQACPSHHGCSDAAMGARDDAQSRAWVANVAFGVGLAATTAGVWLWLSAPSSAPKVSLHVVPLAKGAGLSLAGAL